MSGWATAHRGSKALGVIEARPPPVVVDLHTPTQLGIISNGVDKPRVRGLGAGEILRRDNLATWVDDPKLSHEM